MKTQHALLIAIFTTLLIFAPSNHALCIKHYALRRVTAIAAAEGLHNAYVTALAEDGQGFLWAGTERGVYRLDGRRATRAIWQTDAEAARLRLAAVRCLLYDATRGRMWIGTRREGLFYVDLATGRLGRYAQELGTLPDNYVAGLALAGDGTLWTASYHNGLARLAPGSTRFTTLTRRQLHAVPDDISGLTLCPDGTLLIASWGQGLTTYNPATRQTAHYSQLRSALPSDRVRTTLSDSQGNIWCATAEGLACLDRTTGRARSIASLPQGSVQCVMEDAQRRLWVAIESRGVAVIDIVSHEVVTFLSTATYPSLSNQTVASLAQDRYGNVLCGTYGDGIDILNSEPRLSVTLSTRSRPIALTGKGATALATDPATGELWVGLDDGGIDVLTHLGGEEPVTKRNFSTSNSPLSLTSVSALRLAGDGTLWVATYSGQVLRRKAGTASLVSVPLPGAVDIRSIAETRDGTMLFACSTGLGVVERGAASGRMLPCPKTIKDRDMRLRALAIDGHGRLYAGTEFMGLYVYDSQLRIVRHITTQPGLRAPDVTNQIIALPGDRLLLATTEGLVALDCRTWRSRVVWRPHSGPPTVRTLIRDRQGGLWLATADNIYKYDLTTATATDYTFLADGVAGDFASRSAAVGPDGRLFFGSHWGVTVFHPTAMLTASLPPVRFTSLAEIGAAEADGGAEEPAPYYISDDGVRLEHDHNTFAVAFSVLDPQYAGKVEYAYQMKGLGDGRWYQNLGDNSLTFRNLPPGYYRLRVRARMPGQPWGEATAELPITVLPPLWLAWWAKCLYSIMAIALICFALYLYRRHVRLGAALFVERKRSGDQQRMNDERLRFFTNITHELRTPLTLILGPLEDLEGDTTLSPSVAATVATIRKSAGRLLSLVNQILDFRKTETGNRQLCVVRGDLATMVRELGLRYKELLSRNTRLRFTVDVADGIGPLLYDESVIATILNNLLSNAVKYTPEGEVRLSMHNAECLMHNDRAAQSPAASASQLSIKHSALCIEVADTGHGITARSLPHIFDRYYQAEGEHQAEGTGIGLALVKALADLHHAPLTVASQPGRGTTFTLTLNPEETYPEAIHQAPKSDEPLCVERSSASTTTGDEAPLILIVEDNADIRDYIAASLAPHYRTLTAADGREGVELATTDIPDIIVSDIMMPVMDGIELTRRVKGDVRTSHIPVVLLTAKDAPRDREEGYDVGADSYLTKPFSSKLLLSRLRNILDQRRRLAAAIAATPVTTTALHVVVTGHGASAVSEGNSTASIQPTALNGVGTQHGASAGGEESPTASTQPMCAGQSPVSAAPVLSKLDRDFLTRLEALVEDNMTATLDIEFLCDRLCMSNSTLYRKVKGLTGLSPNNLIRKRRLARCRRLIADEQCTVSEAAYRSGFGDLSYFRTCFKAEFGMTPTEYSQKAGRE